MGSVLAIAFASSSLVKQTPSGIPKGIASSGGNRAKFLNKITSLFFSSPEFVSHIYDFNTACYCHWLFALSNPEIYYLSDNFVSNILEALQILEENWQSLIEDIALGKLNKDLQIDSSIRIKLEKIIKPEPLLALELERKFQQGFEQILPRIWTSLAYIQCITTGSMELYKEKLKFYAGDVPIYSGNYGSSEAWVGLNLEPERNVPAYTITPHSAFFEFIHVSEFEQNSTQAKRINSLKIGEKYEIVVTTIAGLYRYRTGDTAVCITN